jgi:MtN3 and saliva related transmembrane protein
MSDTLLQTIGIIAGICTSSSIIPQIIKTVKTKTANDVSPFMFIILVLGTGLWAFYGVAKSDLPIIITNAFSFLLNIFMLILNFRYKKKD